MLSIMRIAHAVHSTHANLHFQPVLQTSVASHNGEALVSTSIARFDIDLFYLLATQTTTIISRRLLT